MLAIAVRAIALILLAACEPATRVVVLDEVDRSPVAGVQVAFHRRGQLIAELRTDVLGMASLDTDEIVDVSVRAADGSMGAERAL